ncbi:MAG: hypothetical protein Q9226_007295 [Calogaya cf. arnoldii]
MEAGVIRLFKSMGSGQYNVERARSLPRKTAEGREKAIRAITPDIPVKTTTLRSDSDSELESDISLRRSSPRFDARDNTHDSSNEPYPQSRHRRQRTHSSSGTAKTHHSPSSTRNVSEYVRSKTPPNVMTKARQRIASLQSSANRDAEEEENTSSIGFPSVIPSPPLETERHGPRRRLVKPQSRPLSPARGSHSIRSTASNASSATDVSKVLQLMKTTCGRMHGILSFRTSGSGSWSSGYCAINVATGSLIYQTKGDVSHARTLIPDLRGCQVRTLYDDESRSTFLEVSNHTTMIGVHLRPHVAETFDSWLAALLCWQPIRPKGANNHMARAKASPTSERKTVGSRRTSDFGDRRRNSEIFPHKDAAIIKVGRMLMWDKDFRNGISASTANRRVSTYRQQRSISTSWQKVSCTLQENGHFKLYTEADVAMVSMLPLCQLQRCAVQRLHPSVLDDEFCIAIYPRYASSMDQIVHPTPVYLSLESRVLFEVWFVLLRAFTIPELYGPEQTSAEPQLASVEAAKSSSRAPSPSVGMFRVEKLLSLRIIEAKMYISRKRHSRRSSIKPQYHDQSKKMLLSGNYFAEVRIDGMVRGKTAVKYETGNPFWREDFQFTDLPPVLSSASIEIKTRNPGQKDWTLVSDGPLDLERAQLDPGAIVGDIEISPLESTHGTVELQFDENEHVVRTEKWWPIINDAGDILGETLMELRIEELVVLMGKDYQPLSELLHAFSNSLTVQIASAFPPDVVRKLAEILLNIFQVSAQASEWLLSLVEDEIDNVHKETHHSRYRYGRRIASNDSFESGIERELIVRDLGKSAVVEANQLFRGNTLLTKALDCHMKRLGHDYLEETLGEKIRNIDESNPNCEVDPNRVHDPDDLQANWQSLSKLIESIWSSIYASALRCPPELRMIFRHIAACAEDRYGDFLHHPRPQAQRTLTLISKTLNTLANLGTFGSKEPWMEPMNAFLNTHRQEFKAFVDTICAISPGHGTSPIPPSYATPITILGRLPGTSREGFPSLPYLIDQAKECAALVDLWLNRPHDLEDPLHMSDELQSFNDMCEFLKEKAKHCVSRAEQAERPSGLLEPKWEELVEQMGRHARLRMGDEEKARSETKVEISAKDRRRRSRLRIEPDNDPPAAPSKNAKSNGSTQNSSTASLVSSYFHRNHDGSRETSRQGTPLDSTSTLKAASSEGRGYGPAASAMTMNGQRDEYELDVEGTGIDTPPGSSSAVWDPGVLRRPCRHTPVTASSGEERGFGSEEVDTDFTEAGSSIYRIGTPAASSRGQRHHRSSNSSSKHKSTRHHHHRTGNRSGFSIDAAPELSSIPNRSPLSSRDGVEAPPNGKSIYRLKSPMTASERPTDPVPRIETPRTPGSRDGGKHLFPDFGSVFRKKAREQQREEGR